MSADPTADLITRLAAQDRTALAELYRATGAKLFGVCLHLLGDRTAAEAALQEVYVRIWLRARRFDPARDKALTWLVGIARGHAIERLRAEPGQPPAAADELAPADPRAGIPQDEGRVRPIGDCIGAIEPARAEGVRAAYIDGLSYAEVSARHDVPEDAARTWLRRSLATLRECLHA